MIVAVEMSRMCPGMCDSNVRSSCWYSRPTAGIYGATDVSGWDDILHDDVTLQLI